MAHKKTEGQFMELQLLMGKCFKTIITTTTIIIMTHLKLSLNVEELF